MRTFKVFIWTFLLTNTLIAQQNKLELNSYTNQPEISAFESVTLKPGVHIPTGATTRIFVAESTPANRYLNTSASADRNFVLVRNFKIPGVSKSNLAEMRTLAQENQNITYYDNWGRATQSVSVMVSNTYRDIVTPIRYDSHGQQSTKYLPFADPASSNGSFKSDDLNKQLNFYSANGYDPLVSKTSTPFEKIVYDGSPGGVVSLKGAPGSSWQPNANPLRFEETFNNLDDFSAVHSTRKVRRFKVDVQDTLMISVPTADGYYAVGEIQVRVTKDNNWRSTDGRLNTVEAYIDKRGKLILERSFVQNQQGDIVILSTYYVYSELGELYFTLPPALNPDISTLTAAGIDMYGYRNNYDKKRRLIQKKEPGNELSQFIYNSRDQLVASQNPNQKSKNQWSFTKYDSQGRVIATGIFTSTANYFTLREAAETALITSENRINTGNGYTNQAWPTTGITAYNRLNYYDDYDVVGLPSTLVYTTIPNTKMISYPTGEVTVTKTWTGSNAGTALWTVNYFDKYGQVIQSKSTNHLDGIDHVDNSYDFSGQLISSTRKHHSSSTAQLAIVNSYEYDQVGKIRAIRQKINNQEEMTLVEFNYNEIGQLVDKKLHKKAGQTKFLQSIDYRYNERGWLTSINDPNLIPNSPMNDGDMDSNVDLFGVQFLYNTDSKAPQFNGNIASMRWKTSRVGAQSVAPPKMGYQYRYDALNRMTAAIAERNDVVDNAHSEFVKYDVNGNLTDLGRYAYADNAKQQIDSLVYTYDGYRTKKIDDLSLATVKSLGYDDKVKEAIEYLYDANGNMIEDKNKQLILEYDDRNLIKKITFGGVSSHRLEFLYDRTGKKLQAKYTNGSNVYTIDYLDGIQYQQGEIAFIHTGEGRARRSGTTYTYEYDIKDNLGNVRVTFIPDPANSTQTVAKVVQQNSYYAYGLPMYGDAANNLHLAYVSGEKSKYLYSGKELYDQGGLNWFDYGSRMYDPAIGRWSVMDPAGQFANPYLALGNNPVIGVDPNGEFFIPILVGAAVGVLANGISNTIQDQSFFNGWGMAAIMGGVGGYMSVHSSMATMTVGQQALGAGVGVASSYVGVNVPIGSTGLSIGLSPALFLGNGGLGYGFNAGISYANENFAIGMSYGKTYWSNHVFTGGSFKETRFGYSAAIGSKDFKIGLGESHFKGGGIDQTTGSINLIGKNWSVSYENDYIWGMGGDDGDRWRTTGLAVTVGDVSAKAHFATGDPGSPGNRPYDEGIHRGRDAYVSRSGSSPDQFRLGSAAIGYRGVFGGWNSESIRHIGQNRIAHDILTGGSSKHFRILPNAPYQGLYYGMRLNNYNTTW